ncbi:MAG: hypothetical protein HZA50_18845 [Planctomycetes bacterium]|nr:hypothetical protein [Planctomycetota bacterium]
MKYLAIIITVAFVLTAGLGCKKDKLPDQADNSQAYDTKMDGPPAAQEFANNPNVTADQKKLSDQMNKEKVPPGADGSTKPPESASGPATAPATAPK